MTPSIDLGSGVPFVVMFRKDKVTMSNFEETVCTEILSKSPTSPYIHT